MMGHQSFFCGLRVREGCDEIEDNGIQAEQKGYEIIQVGINIASRAQTACAYK
jgi:hypothetical protein